MSDIYRNVEESQNLIKKFLGKVPGFKGYIDRVNRRASDKILREVIADRYEEQWQKISRLQRELIGFKQIEYVGELEAAAIKVRIFANKIRTATYGYSPFFDASQVNEEELANVYQYDLLLLESVEAVKRAVENVESSMGTDGINAAIRNLVSVAEDSNIAFEKRDEIMRGASDMTSL